MTGQRFGRYVVESKLGEGGMGTVFRARDEQLSRTVAIKVLSSDRVVDAERKRRFFQEARAASALNHPNIVTIYDVGTEGDTDFIVMEYVAGSPLDQRLPAHGLPLKRALTVAVRIADALTKAHEAGIVHRDLKPSNVMLGDDGTVKVLDFGVAKLLEESDPSGEARTVGVTGTGTVVGTPAYMSPEQAEGRRVDARSDIFSFGALLYEMVTGRRAFSGASALSVLSKIVNDEPLPPRQLTATVPAELEKTILRCLRKDPTRRYQTMADLKVALDDLVEDTNDSIPRARAVARTPPARWTWSVATLALMLSLAGGYYFWSRMPPTLQGQPMVAVPLTAVSGQVRYPTFSPDSDRVAFTWTGPKQDNQDIYVQQIGAGTPLRLTSDPAIDSGPTWSPDGRSIAFLRHSANSNKHEVRLVPPLGGPERKIADIEPRLPLYRPMTIAWCPDSSCLLVPDAQGENRADALFVIPLDGGRKRQLTFPPPDVMTDTDPAISPDGALLIFRRDLTAFTGDMYRVRLASNMTTAGEVRRVTDYRVSANRPAWLPNSREVIFSARGGLWRLDALSGGEPTRLPFVGLDGSLPAISRLRPDGRVRLVYVRAFSDSNVWRVDTTAAGVPASSPPRAAVTSTRADQMPAISSDGRRLAFFSSRSGEFELWVGDPDGSNASQLTSLQSFPGYARWSPDGATLAFHSDPEGQPDVLIVPANGGTARILMPGPRGGAFPSFSRDGRWIYFSGPNAEGQIHVMKIPAAGGDAVNITQNPGSISIESYDGRDLYYVEAAERPSALWQLPLAGGVAVKVLDGVVNGAFDVVEHGIYYIDRASGEAVEYTSNRQAGETRLQYYDFATRRTTTVARDLGTFALGLSATRDGRTIFYARVDSSADELMLVEGFQ